MLMFETNIPSLINPFMKPIVFIFRNHFLYVFLIKKKYLDLVINSNAHLLRQTSRNLGHTRDVGNLSKSRFSNNEACLVKSDYTTFGG